VGWSDGAITGLQLIMSGTEKVNGLFSFGANSSIHGLKAAGSRTPLFSQFVKRAQKEYALLSPRPNDWSNLLAGLQLMWRSQPDFAARQLATVKVPVVIADGDRDEIIKLADTERLAREIPAAHLLILRGVSHFAMLQAPDQFSSDLKKFLQTIQ
jgi:pimeloyl-ACP methyl ester carboxylesterase